MEPPAITATIAVRPAGPGHVEITLTLPLDLADLLAQFTDQAVIHAEDREHEVYP